MNMNKIIGALKCLTFVVGFIGICGITSIVETRYDRKGTIVSAYNYDADTVAFVVTDDCGYCFEFLEYKDTKYKKGDRVILKMHNNFTDNVISDDKILKVKKVQ